MESERIMFGKPLERAVGKLEVAILELAQRFEAITGRTLYDIHLHHRFTALDIDDRATQRMYPNEVKVFLRPLPQVSEGAMVESKTFEEEAREAMLGEPKGITTPGVPTPVRYQMVDEKEAEPETELATA